MRTIRQTTGTLAAFAIAVATLHWILGEATVHFEMWSTGATSRADLANDFGLGLLGLFIVLPGSLIGAGVAAWWVWRKLSLREPTNERVA